MPPYHPVPLSFTAVPVIDEEKELVEKINGRGRRADGREGNL